MLLKLWAEVALFSLLGQWVLGLLIGAKREDNMVYQLLGVVSLPFLWLLSRGDRRLLPAHRRRRWLALWLGVLWLLATAGKIALCLQRGTSACN